ncbi:hypothetical protein [Paludisphaera borealis]|uniref:Uncharacterized protein n=1 Tax=Paludisphaera borealis TaxID=1387353 RepID=A0A1U7CTR4_9BACT|nr:hypothetical protein [Paludisphaera borealis]APW62298.1 hypothetical protein BSF38_03837 [Paludisphaera borealis]
MAVGLESRTNKTVKKVARRKPANPVQELPPQEATPAPHVVGKLNEREPDENAHRPREEPEAAARGAEGLDAGYARYTESSDFSNRGRDRS